MIKQTRIFAPFNTNYPDHHWYENILGKIIKPVIENNSNLDWYWFSRYEHPLSNNSNNENCNINEVKGAYIDNQSTRSIRFRFSIAEHAITAFESVFKKTITDNGCLITDVRDWDMVGDVGSQVHIGGEITRARQERRADLVSRFYHGTSMLTLDALTQRSDNNFEFEKTVYTERIYSESCFTQPHHVFCNITKVPLWAQVKVWLRQNYNSVRTETGWMAAPGVFGIEANDNREKAEIDISMPTNFG